MRLLWYWLGWLALVLYALTLQRDSFLFWAFATLLGLLFLSLLFFTIWWSALRALERMRTAARERRIRTRDATTESPLERSLAARLDAAGIAYVREHRISRVHVDFAFPQSKLAVECDGYRYHHGRKEQDAARDAFLRRNGWTVLRFSGDQIRGDVDRCVREIREHL